MDLSSYYNRRVLIQMLLALGARVLAYRHLLRCLFAAPRYISSVLMLPYVCSYCCMCVLILLYVSAYRCCCRLARDASKEPPSPLCPLLYLNPHTILCVRIQVLLSLGAPARLFLRRLLELPQSANQPPVSPAPDTPHTHPASSAAGPGAESTSHRYSVNLLYAYKSTNTDAEGAVFFVVKKRMLQAWEEQQLQGRGGGGRGS
jgi:hypothetical protein